MNAWCFSSFNAAVSLVAYEFRRRRLMCLFWLKPQHRPSKLPAYFWAFFCWLAEPIHWEISHQQSKNCERKTHDHFCRPFRCIKIARKWMCFAHYYEFSTPEIHFTITAVEDRFFKVIIVQSQPSPFDFYKFRWISNWRQMWPITSFLAFCRPPLKTHTKNKNNGEKRRDYFIFKLRTFGINCWNLLLLL